MAGFKFFLSTIIFLFSLLIATSALLGVISSHINPNSSGLIALAGVLLPVSLLANFFYTLLVYNQEKMVDNISSSRSRKYKLPLIYISI